MTIVFKLLENRFHFHLLCVFTNSVHIYREWQQRCRENRKRNNNKASRKGDESEKMRQNDKIRIFLQAHKTIRKRFVVDFHFNSLLIRFSFACIVSVPLFIWIVRFCVPLFSLEPSKCLVSIDSRSNHTFIEHICTLNTQIHTHSHKGRPYSFLSHPTWFAQMKFARKTSI